MDDIRKGIEKLIKDYDSKISDCDTLIKTQRKGLSKYRRGENTSEDEDDRKAILKERAIAQAQRQAYVQAKYDIDSLLDLI